MYYLPHAVEAIVGAVDGQHRSTCVCLGHAAIALEDDYFGPDLVVDLRPFVQHFLYVFLCEKKRHRERESVSEWQRENGKQLTKDLGEQLAARQTKETKTEKCNCNCN